MNNLLFSTTKRTKSFHKNLTYVLVFIASVFLSVSVFAQPSLGFANVISGVTGIRIGVDSKGNSYVISQINNETVDFDPSPTSEFPLTNKTNSSGEIVISKLDNQGVFIWAKKIGDSSFIQPNDLKIDKNDNLYIAGTFEGNVDFNPDQDPLKEHIVSLISPGKYGRALFILKLDSNGEFVWVKTAINFDDNQSNTSGISLAISEDSKIYMTGYSGQTSINFEGGNTLSPLYPLPLNQTYYFIWSIDFNGNFNFAKQFEPDLSMSSNGWFHLFLGDITTDVNNDIIVSGLYTGTVDFDLTASTNYHTSKIAPVPFNEYYSSFVVKLDKNGNFKWLQEYGDSSLEMLFFSQQIETDLDGNIFVSGNFRQSWFSNSNGVVLASPIDVDPSAEVLNLEFNATYQNTTPFLLRLDENGMMQWIKNTAYSSQGGFINNLAIDKCGSIYLHGVFQGTCDFDPSGDSQTLTSNAGMFVSKLDNDGNFNWVNQFAETVTDMANRLGGDIVVDTNYSIYFTSRLTNTTPFDVDPGPNTFEVINTTDESMLTMKLTQSPPKPLSFTTVPATICKGDSSLVTLQGGSNYTWSPAESVHASTTDSTFYTKPLSTTTYTVKGKSNGCPVTTDITITVNNSTVANAGNDTTVCAGTTISLNGLGGTSNFSWDNGPKTRANVVTPNDTTTYIFSTQDGICKASDTVVVNVNPLPITGLSTTPIVIDQFASTVLTASGGGTYLWTPADGLSCSDCAKPTASPTKNENYCVTVTDSNNCKATSCVEVKLNINCGDLFIPTGFSPNGDNINDKLEVKINPDCITEYNFMIFDRWGEKVFETTKITETWDGKYNGKELDNAVFVYYLKVKLIDSDKYIEKKGNVSIIK